MQETKISHTFDGKTLTLKVKGSLDYADSSIKKQFCIKCNPKHIIIDLKQTFTITSSGLGLILLLKELSANSRKDNIKIINTNEKLRQILLIACFDLFLDIY